MFKIPLGSHLELNDKEVKKYLESNEALRLDGDSHRNLTLRKGCHSFFLRGYFDNDKVLVAIINLEPDEDTGEYYWTSQFIPTSCILISKNNISIPELLQKEITLFEGLQNYENYIKEITEKSKERSKIISDLYSGNEKILKYIKTLINGLYFSGIKGNIIMKIPFAYLTLECHIFSFFETINKANNLGININETYHGYDFSSPQNYLKSLKNSDVLKDIFVSGKIQVSENVKNENIEDNYLEFTLNLK